MEYHDLTVYDLDQNSYYVGVVWTNVCWGNVVDAFCSGQ